MFFIVDVPAGYGVEATLSWNGTGAGTYDNYATGWLWVQLAQQDGHMGLVHHTEDLMDTVTTLHHMSYQ